MHVSATHVAEVEVDTRKGTVRVLRVVWLPHDVGRAIYPQGLKGQIEGAVSMGIGFALKEEFHPGETTGFSTITSTSRETPEVVTLMVEMVDPRQASAPRARPNVRRWLSRPPSPTPSPMPREPGSTIFLLRPFAWRP